MSRRYRIFAIAVVLTLIGDQVTKYFARQNLVLGHAKQFLGGVWDWELSYNTGSAFGLFHGVDSARWFLTIIGIVACFAILYIVAKKTKDERGWIAAALGLVFGGALGNVIDRLHDAKVTDFVLWHIGEHRWPAFNVADAALVAGVIILFFDFGKKKEHAPKKS